MGRRNVTKNLLETEVDINDGDIVGKVLEISGKCLFLVEYPKIENDEQIEGESTEKVSDRNLFRSTLCTLPTKFRNMVWVKRGSFITFRRFDEKDGKLLTESKIGGIIQNVLFPYHIKRLKLQKKWPEIYNDDIKNEESEEEEEEEFSNPNLRRFEESSSEEE